MHNDYLELISTLSGRQNLLLASLLSSDDAETWEQIRHLVISHLPILTLEMAVNRICQREPNSIPSPSQIHAALEYANNKKKQFAKNTGAVKVTD